MWHQLILVGGLGATLLFAGGKIHVVEKGDTLYQISRDYHVAVADIVRANPGAFGKAKLLQVGQKLRIPVAGNAASDAPAKKPTPPPTAPAKKEESDDEEQVIDKSDDNASAPAIYIVKKGDTLSDIGRRFKISPGQLRNLNNLQGSTLRIGQKLNVHPPAATGGPSGSQAPLGSSGKQRYLFIDQVKAKIDAPRVVAGRWKYIVVHHSGTPSGNAKIFDYFHRNIRGMENGLAYHFVIGNGNDSRDGEIEVGERWMRQIQGGHLHSDALNEIALGICFVGDFNSSQPTKKQIAAAIELIAYLNEKCATPPVFKAHREINPRPTECPGKNFPAKAFHQLFDL